MQNHGWASATFGKAYSPGTGVISIFDEMMTGLDSGALRGDLANEYAGMRGWNWLAVTAKSNQFSLSETDVFVSGVLKGEIEKVYGVEQKSSNGTASAAQSTNVPDGYEVAPSQYRIQTLMSQPNRWEAGHQFKYRLGQQLEVFGVCYILVTPSTAGTPVEMFIIPKPHVTFWPHVTTESAGVYRIGSLVSTGIRTQFDGLARTYREQLLKLSNRTYPAHWVIEIGLPHPFAMDDYASPSDAMSDTLQTDFDLHASRRSVLNNQMSMGPQLKELPGVTMTPDQKEAYLASMMQRAAGTHNQGRPFWQINGVEIDNGQYSSREMEYSKSVVDSRDAILSQRGVPPTIVGISEQNSYAGGVVTHRGFTQDWVQPGLNMVGSQLTVGLRCFFDAPYNQFWIRFTAGQMDDPSLKETQITNDLASLAITKKEYRSMRQLEPFGDERDTEIAGQPPAPPAGMPGMPGLPGMPGSPPPGAPAGDTGTGIGAAVNPGDVGSSPTPSAPETKTAGEYADMSRLQQSRNLKAVAGLLQDVTDGKTSEGVCKELLNAFGIDAERAERMIQAALAAKNPVIAEDGGGPSAIITKAAIAIGQHRIAAVASAEKAWIGARLTGRIRRSVLTWRDTLSSSGFRLPSSDPHITLLCPLTSTDKEVLAKFRRIVRENGPVTVFFGAGFLLHNAEETVVAVEVSGQELIELHNKLAKELPNISTHLSYRPHVTIAYCKHGEGQNLQGMVWGGVTGEVMPLSTIRIDAKDTRIASARLGEQLSAKAELADTDDSEDDQ